MLKQLCLVPFLFLNFMFCSSFLIWKLSDTNHNSSDIILDEIFYQRKSFVLSIFLYDSKRLIGLLRSI
ncbi:hypothetical protein GGQ57_004212 [Parabacteroides faecis]|uniref:Uncharacterized protein n=1 Tax=Parabacteroides faecis TaxID=1217282 RepID=A0ABR6KTX4_9BACT|nr:hypothetical protein [Parabacteroides faecis]